MDIFNSIFYIKGWKNIYNFKYSGKRYYPLLFASGTNTNFADIDLGTRIGAIGFLPAMFFFKNCSMGIKPLCRRMETVDSSYYNRFIWIYFFKLYMAPI